MKLMLVVQYGSSHLIVAIVIGTIWNSGSRTIWSHMWPLLLAPYEAVISDTIYVAIASGTIYHCYGATNSGSIDGATNKGFYGSIRCHQQ